MGAPPPAQCPTCGSDGVARVYSRVAVRFSGWGFSRTDSLVRDDRPRKNFKKLREKAEEVADS